MRHEFLRYEYECWCESATASSSSVCCVPFLLYLFIFSNGYKNRQISQKKHPKLREKSWMPRSQIFSWNMDRDSAASGRITNNTNHVSLSRSSTKLTAVSKGIHKERFLTIIRIKIWYLGKEVLDFNKNQRKFNKFTTHYNNKNTL